ncbi:hypothetical protein FS837_011195, partial [Tulasnella sp. UAMH 9824]
NEKLSKIDAGFREETVEPPPTSENFDTIAEATPPSHSRFPQTLTADGRRRDSRIKPPQLPEEILIEIIHFAASNPGIDPVTEVLSDPMLLQSLTSYRKVCKRWKAIIDGTPSLWTFLSANDVPSFEAFQRVIEKSGNAPLVISYGREGMELQHFVEAVIPLMHRCKVVWIGTSCLDDQWTLQPLLSQPCPILEELHFDPACSWTVSVDDIDSNTGQDSNGRIYFDIWALRHNAERLRALSFCYVEGRRMGSKLTNLRELKLEGSRIWFKSLVEYLAESSLLRTLTIDRSLRPEMDESPDSAIAIELPFLARIELRAVDASFAHALLSRINPTALKQLAIHIWEFESPLFLLRDVGPAYQALFLSLMKAQGAIPIPIEVGIDHQRLSVIDNKTGRMFELSAEEIWPDGGLVHFVESLSNITRHWSTMSTPSFALLFGTTDPDLRGEEIHITQECLRSLMDIEGVTEIRLGPMADNVQGVYKLLSYPVDGEDQPWRWLLPRLSILEVEEHQSHDIALVQMLEARYATTVAAAEVTLAPLPLSLLKLVRHSSKAPESQIMEKIRNIVGAEYFQLGVYEVDKSTLFGFGSDSLARLEATYYN